MWVVFERSGWRFWVPENGPLRVSSLSKSIHNDHFEHLFLDSCALGDGGFFLGVPSGPPQNGPEVLTVRGMGKV